MRIYPFGRVTVSVPASAKIAVYSRGPVDVHQVKGYPAIPSSLSSLINIDSGMATTAAFSAAGTAVIEAGFAPVVYDVGTDAAIKGPLESAVYQGAPVALNATGALTAAAILSGIVTSTTAAAVAATLPTGAVMDLASTFEIGDAFDWSVITTGANALTVTAAASGHTVVGNMVVAAGKAGRFRTRKTAADTFVTYSLSNT